MSSFSTAAEVSLRTETRKEGRKKERREGSESHSRSRSRTGRFRVVKGRQTRSMRCRFMAQRACLRLGALLVVVVVVVVGDWAACPSLPLQRGSCVMAPIHSTLIHSGMSPLCV